MEDYQKIARIDSEGFMNQNVQRIRNVLQQFSDEEVGNRLSNFALLALRQAVDGELQQIEKTLAELGEKKDTIKEELM